MLPSTALTAPSNDKTVGSTARLSAPPNMSGSVNTQTGSKAMRQLLIGASLGVLFTLGGCQANRKAWAKHARRPRIVKVT